MKRFMKIYCAWASASEANFLHAITFGGFGAITIVMIIAYLGPFSVYCGSTVLEYLSYFVATLTGCVGGALVYRVQKYHRDHPEL